jgi:NAD(P)-dependent dehydrogenase (short-subunit alcohol dehydrogenase family)
VRWGIVTVGDITPDPVTGPTQSEAERLRDPSGRSTGIGLATAVRLADGCAYLFGTGRGEAELEAAVTTVGTDRATAVAGHLSTMADLDRLYGAVRARGEGLDELGAYAASEAAVRSFARTWAGEPRTAASGSTSSRRHGSRLLGSAPGLRLRPPAAPRKDRT